jgi:hypothetical protein
MSIAITEEHRALAQTVAGLLTKHQSRAAARSLLGAQADVLPGFWAELSGLGLLGLHIPEEHGGSGFGLPETLVVAEQMGRYLAPGPFVPTVVASAVLATAARTRDGRDHGGARGTGRGVPGRQRRDGGHPRADEPGHVDRRRHV